MRRIFDDKSVDIVSIATPNHWHSLAAIWAMQAGKDVYVEKPVSHNISEGRRMVQVARKYNRICQGGTQYRSTGANRAAAQYVREGKLGQIKLAHVCTYRSRTSIGPAGQYSPPPTVDYNLWAGPAPMELPVRRKSFHYDWHWFWDWGGGELGNNSVHPVDAMRMVVGLEGPGPRRAQLRRARGPGRLRRDAQRAGHHPRLRARSPSSRRSATSRPPTRSAVRR